ncbi:MAG: PEP/pyruvate-binding domain-containing protein [Pseudomonadota bacterium]
MSQAAYHYVESLSTTPSLSSLGGKGKSLASLIKSGFAVPDGFHITTRAYRRFLENNRLHDKLYNLAKPVVKQGSLSFEPAATRIQAMMMEGMFPEEVREEVLEAWTRFRDTPVAVRSSATAEDLPDLSFAGQQDTYLNVCGEARLLEAIQQCWASLWTARAIGYRHQMGIAHEDIAMAVVVQAMVNADVSGVLFTANPATGARDEIIVNASWGLGEAIVSGQVTPDAYIIDRGTFTVKESALGAKGQMIVSDGDSGTRLMDVAPAQRDIESLQNQQLLDLVALAVKVEDHFEGQPQDIEWLFADDRLWLLQSRPITNLPPAPLRDVTWEPPEPNAYLGRSQLVEHLPDPVSTLFEDLHMKQSLQHYWGMNLSARGQHDFEDTQPPASFFVQTTINGYAYRHLGEPPRTGKPPSRRQAGHMPRRPSRLLGRLRGYWLQAKLYLWFVPEWRYFSLPRYLKIIERWRALDPVTATTEQLWKGIREMSRADARYWYRGGVWNAFSLTRGTEFELHQFLQQQTSGNFTSGQFLSGLRSVALEGQINLWRIAEKIRSNQSLHAKVIETPPRRLLEFLRSSPEAIDVANALDDYFAEYGHQIFTLDFAEPCEAESPINTMHNLHAMVLQPDFDPIERQRELAGKRRLAEEQANSYFRGAQRRKFKWLLWKARHYYPNREEAMFYMGKAWTVLRPLARELGKRLLKAGTLHEADHIYFLTTAELGKAVRALVADAQARARGISGSTPAVIELADQAVARRDLREARRQLNPPFHVPGPPPWARKPGGQEEDAAVADNVLTGSPVSPGKVTALASLVLSPAEFDKMRPGTILVCPTTTPAWTSLFPQAVGLVTNIGGILAHGSIVAREYGIPAVLGIEGATEQIRDGQLITVDGDRGTVTLESPDAVQGGIEPTEGGGQS